ncbi:family 78 glycoside hydrolase catalytic domain [Tuanshanicoccus lijuaniae]|uniref:family 78 glycoside hydrolase catalytic domain n=1 Tax=Aerococcaceae bacterium zg-1292 TaxID=2774330 RepID=UPI001BD8B290|nr:family 78 glycoside hydrolase catalytic domain [Aerococcaceae bacterium zg-A91]MBS4457882.1 family 78 glycoside hydrolase catalytic domain [Aerococcaceae bacterium zg-BR33]
MLEISRFTCENLEEYCITDVERPAFSYAVSSDVPNTTIKKATLVVNDWTLITTKQIAIEYQGAPLQPFQVYQAHLTVVDNHGQVAEASLSFEMGRLTTSWQARWITDGNYRFTEKKVSPKPMLFRRFVQVSKPIKTAKLYSTALGIYYFMLNGVRVGQDYFAPGFTSYKHQMQYQVYDVTTLMHENNELTAIVAGGWAVGTFVMNRKNRITADRQALLAELHLQYEDGTTEIIFTNEQWEVSVEHAFRLADLYDGETYDASIDKSDTTFHSASVEQIKINPHLRATYGSLTRPQEVLTPVSQTEVKGKMIYDFGQNFAGVVQLTIKNARIGQKIIIKHAEILHLDGSLNTSFLRTAKATVTYICREGSQTYVPSLTYMGFRYISIEGIQSDDVIVEGVVLHSTLKQIGHFETSNPLLNQLQSNIVWSSKSNFVDIPTDCPQRDERMGWTGDIAVFAPTANFNFDMSRFIDKWLIDVQSEQSKTGGIPNTVPAQGYGFPETMPQMAIDFWGDACVLVPWQEYQARGDLRILERFYPVMKKYVKACKFWAGLFSVGKHRYIWHTPSVLHFGDWVAPDVEKMSQWQKRSKWTATASLKNTSHLVAQIAQILGNKDDAAYFNEMSQQTAEAYEQLLMDSNGRLSEEFQTGYVLPIHYHMLQESIHQKAVNHLVRLIENNDYCIGTGFPGTPYILFALADNGRSDVAYKMLLNTLCPSWLYQVKMGATTIWERWDGLDEEGNCPIGDDGTDIMISYNHYASGAVGDFLYKRVAGIEATVAGYREFEVNPIIGGELTYTNAHVETPYGVIRSYWRLEGDYVHMEIDVPVGTVCHVKLNNQSVETVSHGHHVFTVPYYNEMNQSMSANVLD